MKRTPALLPPLLPRLLKRLLLPALLLACSAPAHAWWSHDWSFRKQITLNPQQAGVGADQANAVVLIRLHEGVLNFADANPDGSDLRFVAGDDKTPLHFHIERFDSVFNLGFAWVQIPELKAGQPVQIWMYYGNAKATADSRTADTYDPDQLLVYHFGEKGAPPADASAFKHNAASAALPDDGGLIGAAARFDGNTAVLLPASPSLNLAAGQNASFSMWLKPAAASNAVVYAQRDAGRNALLIGLAAGVPYVAVETGGTPAGRAQAGASIADGSWHHLAVVASPQLTLYVDGVAKASLAATLPAIAGAAVLGADGGTAGAPLRAGFAGEIDELNIAKAARSAAALQLQAQNQGPGDKLVSFGADEAQSSWSTGYVGIILGSVTLDGWVVIGVLAVMMLVSWTVMAFKGVQIGRVSKGNAAFLDAFRAAKGDLHALGQAVNGGASGAALQLSERDRRRMQDSPLLQMFTVGVEELRSRLTGEGGSRAHDDYLSEQSIEAIRAAIDSSLIRQIQALNKRMVLLTIAISGGPFIGLLGTVVGVMITFAAVAAAGDVNINAIAPGIAAALAATVAGLFVAIPALFGYNYLITRIKECTAEMQVFIDAFTTRMAESYNRPAALHALAGRA